MPSENNILPSQNITSNWVNDDLYPVNSFFVGANGYLSPLTHPLHLNNAIYSRYLQKQPSNGIIRKRCSEDMQQIYRITPIPKCDFNKVAKQLYWNCTLPRVFSCKFCAYFQNIFLWEHQWSDVSVFMPQFLYQCSHILDRILTL